LMGPVFATDSFICETQEGGIMGEQKETTSKKTDRRTEDKCSGFRTACPEFIRQGELPTACAAMKTQMYTIQAENEFLASLGLKGARGRSGKVDLTRR